MPSNATSARWVGSPPFRCAASPLLPTLLSPPPLPPGGAYKPQITYVMEISDTLVDFDPVSYGLNMSAFFSGHIPAASIHALSVSILFCKGRDHSREGGPVAKFSTIAKSPVTASLKPKLVDDAVVRHRWVSPSRPLVLQQFVARLLEQLPLVVWVPRGRLLREQAHLAEVRPHLHPG